MLRIHEKQARLTASERKIADVLLRDQGFVETHSATELAAASGVSKATAARFFRSLGYADFEEVRLQARDERNRREPYLRPAPPVAPAGFGRTISEHLDLEVANLTRTFEELRPDTLSRIAQLMEAAPQVWLLGFGAETGLAAIGQALFSRLRHHVRHIEGRGQDWTRALAAMGPRDLMLVMTLEPRPRLLRTIIGYARTSRVRVVTLTDHVYRAQAERYSDVVLPCHIASYGPVDTHATLLSMLRLLAIALAARSPETARQRVETLDSIREELDLDE
jgi:DNA-binding MurR/RpiR family transcriptional regulator